MDVCAHLLHHLRPSTLPYPTLTHHALVIHTCNCPIMGKISACHVHDTLAHAHPTMPCIRLVTHFCRLSWARAEALVVVEHNIDEQVMAVQYPKHSYDRVAVGERGNNVRVARDHHTRHANDHHQETQLEERGKRQMKRAMAEEQCWSKGRGVPGRSTTRLSRTRALEGLQHSSTTLHEIPRDF